MIYSQSYQPRIDDFDRFGQMSPEAVLHILEDCACRHTAAVDEGVIEKSRHGLAWILTEWNFRILRRPVSGESFTVNTWTCGKPPAVTIRRELEARAADGQTLVLAEATLGLLERETERLARITQDAFERYAPEERTLLPPAAKLRAPQAYDTEKRVQLRRADLDFNGHLHNTRYLELAAEVLPETLARRAQNFRISYRRALGGSGDVTVRLAGGGEQAVVGIYDGQETLCALVCVS